MAPLYDQRIIEQPALVMVAVVAQHFWPVQLTVLLTA